MNAVTERGRFIIAAIFALLGCASVSGQGSPDYELQKQWEAQFDVFQAGFQKQPEVWLAVFQNWVLCPDGSLYSLVDRQGSIRRTSADGKTNPENIGAIGFPASLLTCDQKDQLYVASGKNLEIYSLAQGKLVRLASAREKFFVQAAG